MFSIKFSGFRTFGPIFKSWLYHEFSASHSISVSIGFLVCRMRIIDPFLQRIRAYLNHNGEPIVLHYP